MAGCCCELDQQGNLAASMNSAALPSGRRTLSGRADILQLRNGYDRGDWPSVKQV